MYISKSGKFISCFPEYFNEPTAARDWLIRPMPGEIS